MKQIQFIFNGGLGNQIFQYLASKYISEELVNLKVEYGLSEYILNGGRHFELNKLLLSPLQIKKENNNYFQRVYTKLINKILFFENENIYRIKFYFDLLNNLYYENTSNENLQDPIKKLLRDLKLINNFSRRLKINGFWQNPSSYMGELENYKKLFINTKKQLPTGIIPNNYISIHIRKGDYYLTKDSIDSYYSKFSPIKFILLSLELLPEDYSNLPIYLISDDISWRNYLLEILSNSQAKKFRVINTRNHIEDWSILRHSSVNICSNSTFSYTAALLNNDNKERKLRCIVPQWIYKKVTAYEQGWLEPQGFVDL